MMTFKTFYCVSALVLILAVGLEGQKDYEEAKAHNDYYEEMVQLWQDSNGEYGWPPYKEEK